MENAEPKTRVAVFSKPHPLAADMLRAIGACLGRHGVEVRYDRVSADALGRDIGVSRADAVQDATLVVSLGGDGTLLSSARVVGARQIPILGVNIGNLGFLTETSAREVAGVLDATLEGRARLIRRRLLAMRRESDPTGQELTALNDVTFSKKDLARLFSLSLFVDGEWVSDYRADGLIIATPTGSTAYNLAAGGPIVTPDVDCLLATPICPHSLSQRPLILPGGSQVAVVLASDDAAHDVQLTLDGQVGIGLEPGERAFIRRADHEVLLVRPPGRTFFGVLRDKLAWGHP